MALEKFGTQTLALFRDQKIPIKRFGMLGRQLISLRDFELNLIPDLAGLESSIDELKQQAGGYSEPLIRHYLGDCEIESIDFSDYEDCTRVHDMNQPIPQDWHGRYDLLFDGGTIEHIFHFPNAIANAMNLVREGGYFVACTPSNNFSGHGFYQFSPELFFRLFNKANGFSLMLMAMGESRHRGRLFRIEDPKDLGYRILFDGSGLLQLIVIARRDKVAPVLQEYPYQSDYSQTWSSQSGETGSPGTGAPASFSPRNGDAWKSRLRNAIPKNLLYYYDMFHISRRTRREISKGVKQVHSLSECLREV